MPTHSVETSEHLIQGDASRCISLNRALCHFELNGGSPWLALMPSTGSTHSCSSGMTALFKVCN